MQKRFTKLLAALLVLCMMLTTVMPTCVSAEDETNSSYPTASLDAYAMTESGSITVTFTQTATDSAYYNVEIISTDADTADSWAKYGDGYAYNDKVTSGDTFTISKSTVSSLTVGTYYIYIGYHESGSDDTWKSNALEKTTFTVINESSATYTLGLTVNNDSPTLGGEVEVTATIYANDLAISGIPNGYKLSIWYQADDYNGSEYWVTPVDNSTSVTSTTISLDSTYFSNYTAYTVQAGLYTDSDGGTVGAASVDFTIGGYVSAGNYYLEITLDSGKLQTGDINYPYVYTSSDTTVNVTVKIYNASTKELCTSIPDSYTIYIWFEDNNDDSSKYSGKQENTIGTYSTLNNTTNNTIECSIALNDSSYSFSTGVNYNVYARLDYNSVEVDDSMVSTSFTINTTYSMDLALDSTEYTDDNKNVYVYSYGDTITSTAGFYLTVDGTQGSAVTTIPDGCKLTIWYAYNDAGDSDDGSSVYDYTDILFDSGSNITYSAGTTGRTGTNTASLTVDPSKFTVNTTYYVCAGLYNEGGELLAYAEAAFIIKDAYLYTRTLTLDGDIGVNYYVDLSYVDESDRSKYTIVFTLNDSSSTTTTAEYNSESYRSDIKSGTNLYRYTVNVDSTQMGLSFTAELQKDGTTIQTNTYSVQSYCEKAISNGWKEKDVCAAMLNYGGYSQTYFDNANSDYMANANLGSGTNIYEGWSDPVTGTWSADLSSNTSSASTNISKFITSYGATLVLKSETKIRLYFNANSTDNLTFKQDGDTLTIKEVTSSDSGYGTYSNYVEFGVQASLLSDTLTVTVSNGIDTGTISYSAYAYIYSTLNDDNNSSNNALLNVCKALYFYGVEADAYSNWYKGST